ncbi:MAG TPA: YncE family protein [Steroidobacteraceae bacterium]|jgi:YVTN family beta-propeller protein|nr:YncE family protein [Steroidobacteraceae bacterium]
MSRRHLLPILALVVGLGLTAAAVAQTGSGVDYHLTRSVSLGAPDRWDYLVYDRPSHRVYVAHGDHLTVVDGRTGRVIGQVAGMPGGTHGIAISHAAGLGYTDDGKAGEGVAFSLKTLKVVKHLKAALDADAVTIDPTSGHVFVVDGDPGLLTVIDPKTDRVVATVRVGGKMEYAVAGDNGKVYVNGVEKREIYRVDTRTNRVDAAWPIPQCEAPHGLAVDAATHRLFSSCENQRLVVVNADTGAIVAALPIGRGTDAAAFDPTRKLIFSSNGMDGTLSVIREVDANTFVPAGTIKTALSARTMTVDPDSGRVFLAAADTTAQAMAAARAARMAGKRGPSPFVQGSFKLLFLDPAK